MNMDWFRIALAVILVGESCCIVWLSVKLDRVRELRDKMAAQSNP